jgi:hypothetical protein
MPPVALVAGAVVGAGASMWSAAKQSDAARDAANQQADAAKSAQQMQWDMFQQQQQAQAPWRQAGAKAVGQLSDLTANATMRPISPSTDPAYQQYSKQFQFDPNTDPSYQWRLQQGQKALEASAAARGGFFSGQTGKELMGYGQGMASQEYGNEFNRYMQQQQFGEQAYNEAFNRQMSQNQQTYNQLAGLAGTGQSAVNQLGQWGMGTAQNIGQLGLGAAQGQGAGLQTGAGAWGGAAQNISNQFQSGLGGLMNYGTQQGWWGDTQTAAPTNYNLYGGDFQLPQYSML